jgi:hypothetical protein
MPIEIREIIIRTRIEESSKTPAIFDSKKLKQEIIYECLKQVKQKLNKKFEP